MFLAAFRSTWREKPHCLQRKSPLLWASFAGTHPAGGKGFCRLHASTADQLRRERGCRRTLRCVSLVVKFHAIAACHLPAHGAGAIERCGVLRDGFTQGRYNVSRRLHTQSKRVHAHILPQIQHYHGGGRRGLAHG